jgi:hypothetical protein
MDRELAILRLTCILGIPYEGAKKIIERVERQSPRAAWWSIAQPRKTGLTTGYAITDNPTDGLAVGQTSSESNEEVRP